jgi:hypothetical protein
MGRLKIGSGIQFKADLPKAERSESKLNPIPVIGPGTLEELTVQQTMKEMLDQLLKELPTKEVIIPQKEVDLSGLASKEDMAQAVIKLCQQRDQLESRVNQMSSDLDALHEKVKDASDVVLPEINHVTHVQDVSPEVLKKCKEMLRYSEESLMLKITDLQKKEQKQKKINYVLSGIVLLTIFLHLL